MSFVESGMGVYFRNKCLGYQQNKKTFVYIGYFLMASIVCLINYLGFDLAWIVIISLGMDIAYTVVLYKGSYPQRIAIGFLVTAVSCISDLICFIILQTMGISDISSALQPGEVRLASSIFYIIVVIILFFLMANFKKSSVSLPAYIYLIFIAFMILSATAMAYGIRLFYEDVDERNLLETFRFVAIAILGVILGIIFAFDRLGKEIRKNMIYEKEREQYFLEENYYSKLEETMSTLRMWKHDNHNHLLALQGYMQKEEYDEANSFIDDLMDGLEQSTIGFGESGLTALDAVIYNKYLIAQKDGVTPKISLEGLNGLPIDTISFVSLVGNLLDNSLEACRRIEDKLEAYIFLRIVRDGGMLYIKSKNSSDGVYRKDKNGNLLSTKGGRKGYGLTRIFQTVIQAGGFVETKAEDTHFEINISIPFYLERR